MMASLLLTVALIIPAFINSEILQESTKKYANVFTLTTTSPIFKPTPIAWNLPSESESSESENDENDRNNSDGNTQDIQDVRLIFQFVQQTTVSEPEPESQNSTPLVETEDNEIIILSRSGFQNNQRPYPNQFLQYWPSFGHIRKITTSTGSRSNEVSQFPNNLFSLDLECGPSQTEYNGQCYNVLQERPCQSGQWLVEDEISKKGKCVENKCAANKDTAFFNGKCIKVRSEDLCRSGMKTYLFKSGEVECDCSDGFIYSESDGKCYEAFRQGPCRKNQYFAIPKTQKGQTGSSKPSCISNPCFTDGFFCNASSCPSKKSPWRMSNSVENLPKNCIQFGSPCTKDGKGLFVIHPDTNRPFCQEDIGQIHFHGRIIGNVPTLRCAPGSRRDILGNCRTPATIDFS